MIGIVYAAITGSLEAVTEACVDSSREAITLCITMLGVISMWSGLMEIAQGAGLIDKMSKGMEGFLHFLFPNLREDHPAKKYIATNMIANMLGLGWAATPAGLRAMEELRKDDAESGRVPLEKRHVATYEMCTFLVINISSLQLIPVNMIAYRSQYGSGNAAIIVGPGLVATLLTTIAGVLFCKLIQQKTKIR